MKSSKTGPITLILLMLMALAAIGPAAAGEVETTESTGAAPPEYPPDDPDKKKDRTTGRTNPIGSCFMESSIAACFAQIAGAFAADAGYSATWDVPLEGIPSITVTKADGSEVDDLRFCECDGYFEGMSIRVDRNGLAGRIGRLQEPLGSGVITLSVNDVEIPVNVSMMTAEQATDTLASELVRAGYSVDYTAAQFPYPGTDIVILTDPLGKGVHHLGFRTPDWVTRCSDIEINAPAAVLSSVPSASCDEEYAAAGGL